MPQRSAARPKNSTVPSFPGSAWECSPEAPPPCLKPPQPVNTITYVTASHTGKAEPCIRHSQAEPESEKGRYEHEDSRMAETIIKALFSAWTTASGGKVCHLESGLQMRFAPSFLGSNHIRL